MPNVQQRTPDDGQRCCPKHVDFITDKIWIISASGKLSNPLKPNDLKKRRTAQLTSRCCILYIYSTNISTEYFENAA